MIIEGENEDDLIFKLEEIKKERERKENIKKEKKEREKKKREKIKAEQKQKEEQEKQEKEEEKELNLKKAEEVTKEFVIKPDSNNSKPLPSNNSKLPNRIDEYMKEQESNSKVKTSRELFTAEQKDIDLKTDLSLSDIHNINVLMVNDEILKSCGLKDVFSMYYSEFMRLKISLDRKSRAEFVTINSEEKTGDLLEKASNTTSIINSRK